MDVKTPIQIDDATRARLEAEIEAGLDQVARGELIDGEKSYRRVKERLAARIARMAKQV